MNERKLAWKILGTVSEAFYLTFPRKTVGIGTFGAGLFLYAL